VAIFPKIQSPCPYKGDLTAIMDGDICRLCKRQVVELDALSDAERVALLANCTGEVCVSYRVPLHIAAAAALSVTAIVAPMTAAAQEYDGVEIIVTAGGITDPSAVEFISDEGETAAELPVIYEDTPPANSEHTPETTTNKTASS
jgi:hypothetical protein